MNRSLVVAIMVFLAAFGYAQTPGPKAAVPAAQSTSAPAVTNVDGTWLGTIESGAIKLRVAFNINSTPNGLTATMDSLDQGAKGIPVTSVTRSGSSLTIEMKQISGKYIGEIAADMDTIRGTWSQAGVAMPLLLKRVKQTAELEPRRPQMPVKPYPYVEEEVVIDNAVASVKLAGTLTIPHGKGPFPAVLLITGSGPQDRDESLMGHKPFLVLADHLTRKGVAVLRVDDRGFGKSTGNFATATTADFATDAEASFTYLQSRREVNPRKIGLVGHSEGGIIAPMVAARNAKVAFIVSMAGSGVPGDDILVQQVQLLAASRGATNEQITAAAERQREILTIIKSEHDNATLERTVREKMAGQMPEEQLTMQLKAMESPWFRYFVQYDPASALRQVKCPVLAINGGKDTQVSAKQNLPAIRAALLAAGNKDVETVEFAGLNHLFQTAQSGSPLEYGTIEETISPLALDKISAWILAR